MKDNLLEEGDEVIVQANRYDVPRVRKVFRVTKTLAYVGDYTVRREVQDRGFIREYGNQSAWNRTSFRFGTPELLAETREKAELADTRNEIRDLIHAAGNKLDEGTMPALLSLKEALAAFVSNPSPTL